MKDTETSLRPMDDNHGHRRRLRERFLKAGFDGFADHEIVELLLTLAIPRGDVKPMAKALLSQFGSVRGVLDAPVAELQAVRGIGEVTPIALRVIREAASLYLQQQVEEGTSLGTQDTLEKFWRHRLGGLQHEVFEVVYLDSAARMLKNGVERLEEGTIDRAAVYPRRVMEAALRRSASALVFAHNHPNGNVQPSEMDKTLTRALVLAAATLQVKVLDHLIISPDDVFSFRKAGLL
ncbi:MAG: RadC family protein [Capsulimonadaceae bacterium]